jgi:acetyl esterase/lipase
MRANQILLASLLSIVLLAAGSAAEPPAVGVFEITVPATVQHIPDLEYRPQPGKPAMQLDLACPREGAGPFPAVLIFHGGAWASGHRKEQLPFAFRLAERGYVAATVSYHFAYEAPFPAALHDAKAAVRWLRAHAAQYRVDPDRIAAFGISSGGNLAALLGTTAGARELEGAGGHAEQSSRVVAVVCYAPVTDLARQFAHTDSPKLSGLERTIGREILKTLLGGTPEAAPARYRLASPLLHVSKTSAPALLVHGTADTRVPLEQSELFAEALKAARVEARVHLLDRAPHCLGDAERAQADDAALRFLDERLQPRRVANRGQAIK